MIARKNWLDSLIFNGFYPLCRQLPLNGSYKAATVKGQLEVLLKNQRIDEMAVAMQRVFAAQISESETRKLARYHMRMLAREIMDVYWLETMHSGNIDRFITLKGLNNYLAAKASGRPVILYTAHFGRLIMPAIALGIKGYQTSALTAPVHEDTATSPAEFKYLSYKVAQMQAIMKGDFVNSAESMRALYKVLQRNDTLIVLLDVPPVPGQPFYEAPFLKGIGRFPKGIVKLAIKTGALLVPYFSIEHKGRLVGEFLPALFPDLLSEEAVLQAILQPVEEKIFQHPEQWWMWPWLNAFWSR